MWVYAYHQTFLFASEGLVHEPELAVSHVSYLSTIISERETMCQGTKMILSLAGQLIARDGLDNLLWTLTIFLVIPRGSHRYAAGTPPTVVIEDLIGKISRPVYSTSTGTGNFVL